MKRSFGNRNTYIHPAIQKRPSAVHQAFTTRTRTRRKVHISTTRQHAKQRQQRTKQPSSPNLTPHFPLRPLPTCQPAAISSTIHHHHTISPPMATSSTNPPLGPRYGLGRTNAPGGASNSYNTPAAAFSSTAKTQQRLEAERLERDRKAREERERMEALGQNSLAELSEEQREEISEAVRARHIPMNESMGGWIWFRDSVNVWNSSICSIWTRTVT